MIFPEFLYRLATTDEGKQTLTALYGEVSVTAAAPNDVGGTMLTVPADKCLVLCSAALQFKTAVGAGFDEGRLLVATAEGDRQYELAFAPSAAGGGPWYTLNWTGQAIVPAGWRVRASGTFTGAAAAVTTIGSCTGVLIPRGTFTFDA